MFCIIDRVIVDVLIYSCCIYFSCCKSVSHFSPLNDRTSINASKQGFISQSTVEEIVELPRTKKDKARQLLSSVLGVVRHFPGKFEDFVTILQTDNVLHSDLLEKLTGTG